MRDGPRGELEAGELDHWLEAGLAIATGVSTFAPAYGEDFINIADDVRGLIGGALSRYGQAVHDLHQSTDVAFSDGLITDALAKSGRLLKEKGWWFGASGGIFKIGDAVPPSMAVIGGESRGYVVLDGGGECVVWRGRHAALGADDEGDHKCVSRHVALRLFPIERDSSDIRGIDYNVCIYRCIGFKPVAWPLSGPLTILWVLRFVFSYCGSFDAFRSRWLQKVLVEPKSAVESEHAALCKMLEFFINYDKFDPIRSAGIELTCRRLQIMHGRWKHKLPSASSFAGTNVQDDSNLMVGAQGTSGSLAGGPSPTQWLGDEAYKEAAVGEERRKAREERIAAAKERAPK